MFHQRKTLRFCFVTPSRELGLQETQDLREHQNKLKPAALTRLQKDETFKAEHLLKKHKLFLNLYLVLNILQMQFY